MEEKVWTRRDDETSKAYKAFEIYRNMGRNRSIRKTHDEVYGEGAGNIRFVHHWSSKYDWVDRATAFDDHLEEKRRKKHEAEMTKGLSHAAVRLQKLKKLHDLLEEEIFENEAHWLEDLKLTPDGQRISIPKYNGRIIRDYRKVLADIAEEVGGRQKRVDVTTQGGALQRDLSVTITDRGEDPDVEA